MKRVVPKGQERGKEKRKMVVKKRSDHSYMIGEPLLAKEYNLYGFYQLSRKTNKLDMRKVNKPVSDQ